MSIDAALQQIQSVDRRLPYALPIILIHDGGGTVFQYWMLAQLERPTFGIANPFYETGGSAPGGLPQLARTYAQAIRASVGSGPVLIGGWSLGGLLALEVARVLADDACLRVAGVLLIDSACPWGDQGPLPETSIPIYRSGTSEKIIRQVDACFEAAELMIREWKRPEFGAYPLAVLIRAEDPTQLAAGSASFVDRDGRLGWSAVPELKFLSVVNVTGDHFSMFEKRRIRDVTATIRTACKMLEDAYHSVTMT